MRSSMELGIYTFAELTPDPQTGQTISAHQRLRDLVEEIELADQVGLDVFGVGEHHRPDFTVSSPAVVLAAGAARTSRIRLTSAVTVISSDEPIRVYQQFSTLHLLFEVRADPAGQGVYPLPVQDPLPVWIAVGGAPESAVRAGMLGLPMAIAIIGGMPERFAPFAELHRRAARRARPGHDSGQHQLARVRRRDLAGSGRGGLAAVQAPDDEDRA